MDEDSSFLFPNAQWEWEWECAMCGIRERVVDIRSSDQRQAERTEEAVNISLGSRQRGKSQSILAPFSRFG